MAENNQEEWRNTVRRYLNDAKDSLTLEEKAALNIEKTMLEIVRDLPLNAALQDEDKERISQNTAQIVRNISEHFKALPGGVMNIATDYIKAEIADFGTGNTLFTDRFNNTDYAHICYSRTPVMGEALLAENAIAGHVDDYRSHFEKEPGKTHSAKTHSASGKRAI